MTLNEKIEKHDIERKRLAPFKRSFDTVTLSWWEWVGKDPEIIYWAIESLMYRTNIHTVILSFGCFTKEAIVSLNEFYNNEYRIQKTNKWYFPTLNCLIYSDSEYFNIQLLPQNTLNKMYTENTKVYIDDEKLTVVNGDCVFEQKYEEGF